ncbi:hypothetical protein AGMMS50239_17080 [Bacteroidia bacterium]|nr:hypothetical protein AGMMS50239_17080 [Bacteroidia bacterium]
MNAKIVQKNECAFHERSIIRKPSRFGKWWIILFFVLAGAANGYAQTYYTVDESWGCGLLSDGTAYISRPVKITYVNGVLQVSSRVETHLSFPSSVTLKLWGSAGWVAYGTYTVTEIHLSLDGTQQAALQSVSFPNTITTIGNNCFSWCTNLGNFVLPESLKAIGTQAFAYCAGLEAIAIPASVTTWGSNPFYNCSGLQSVTVKAKQLPACFIGLPVVTADLTGVEEIAGSAFQGCTKLENVTLSESLKTVGAAAFRTCSSLKEITIPASVATIGGSVFSGCSAMTKAVILNEKIEEYQFSNCTSLEEATLSDNLKTIGTQAFAYCKGLEAIAIPASVTTWGSNPFYNCSGLQSVTVKAKQLPACFSGLPVVTADLTGVEEIATSAFSGCTKLENVTLSESLKTVGGSAFGTCSSLKEITIPASVASIGGSVFSGCSAMTKAVILNEKIGDYQFSNCTSLEEATLSDNLKTISNMAFAYCRGLKAIAIPASVTTWGSNSFYNCSGLQSVSVKAKQLPNCFSGLPVVTADLTGVEEIATSAFSGCTKLENVTLSESLKTVGGSAFGTCSSLKEITIPASVASIGGSVFSGCSAMTKAVILNEKIGDYQFNNCTSLEEAMISGNVKTISNMAFAYCRGLKEVVVEWQAPLGGAALASNIFYGVPAKDVTLKVPAGTESLYKAAPVWKEFFIHAAVSVTGVSLDKETLALKVDSTSQLTATVAPADANNQAVSWKSSNESIATVSSDGLVTAKTAGTATITVTTADGGFAASCTVTVTPNIVSVTGVSLDKETLALKVDDTAQLTATVAPADADNQAVSWKSSDESVATVSSDGLVTAKAAGTATITVTTADGGFAASCTLTVTPNIVSVTGVSLDKETLALKVDDTAQLTATVAPAGANNQAVSWKSSDESVATVSSDGLVTAKAAGTATITVTMADGGFTATCIVTVTSNIIPVTNITGVPESMTVEENILLEVSKGRDLISHLGTIVPQDATNQMIVWSITDAGTTGAEILVEISYQYVDGTLIAEKRSVIKAPNPGTFILTATIKDGLDVGQDYVQNFTIKVNPATSDAVTGITLDRKNMIFPVGMYIGIIYSQQLTATVLPADAADKTVIWTSSNPTFATVSSTGLVTLNKWWKDVFAYYPVYDFDAFTTITATTADGGYTATCDVRLSNYPFGNTTFGNQGILSLYNILMIGQIINNGSITIILPAGITLDAATTQVNPAYGSIAGIEQISDDTWKLLINGTSLRSGTDSEPELLVEIGYTANETVNDGKYEAVISELQLNFANGETVTETGTPVVINVDRAGTGIEPVKDEAKVYVSGGVLHVTTPDRESVRVYSISGVLLKNANKEAGEIQIPLGSSGSPVLLVKGSKGWVKKVIR